MTYPDALNTDLAGDETSPPVVLCAGGFYPRSGVYFVPCRAPATMYARDPATNDQWTPLCRHHATWPRWQHPDIHWKHA